MNQTSQLTIARVRAGLSQGAIAMRAKTSLPTVRLYEGNPEAVSLRSRLRLEPVYRELLAQSQASQGLTA